MNLTRQFILCLTIFSGLLNLATAIVGGNSAAAPPPDDPAIFLSRRGRSARVLGVRSSTRYIFRGIRYAQAPIGTLRFQRPRTLHLEGDIDAVKYGYPCPQMVHGGLYNDSVIGDEDCLFVNIVTPQLPDGGEGLPVLVWIHGGGYRHGSSAQYDVTPLVKKQLVLVTVQYRLGAFGFLSSSNEEQPGNAAMFDVIMALRWIRDYISFFGGNPKNVVLMGQGSGASMATLVASSRFSRGYIHGVIAMSGTSISHWSVDKNPTQTARSLAHPKKCPEQPTLAFIRCLQKLSTEEIVQGDALISQNHQNEANLKSIGEISHPRPVIENKFDHRSLPSFIDEDPLRLLKARKVAKVPLLIGITRDETANIILGDKKPGILQKIKSVSKYLENELVKDMKSVTGFLKNGFNNEIPILGSDNVFMVLKNFGKKSKRQIPGGKAVSYLNQTVSSISQAHFNNYFKLTNANDVTESLNKIIEATSDVFFSLPAYLTVHLWSKIGIPAYLYRFEHKGNAAKGFHFLKGAPFVSKAEKVEADRISHGDDIGYLFNPLSIDGKELNSKLRFTTEDEQVRDIFTDLIAQFSHGILKENKKSLLSKYSESANNYLSIKAKPKTENNFRFCEIGLWGDLGERMISPLCKSFNVLDENVRGVQQKISGVATGLTNSTSQVSDGLFKPFMG